MTVSLLNDALRFPDVNSAEEDGLVAVGGDLSPARLILAYGCGLFPWYDQPPILWFSPDPRAAIIPSELKVPRRLNRWLRGRHLELSLDRDFSGVLDKCASVPRPGQNGTWINQEMKDAYNQLHKLGFAHSCEAWLGERLVGGVYGVSLGGAFFAESMFFLEPNASSAALVYLTRQLERWKFSILDCQIQNPHLKRFGIGEWSRNLYLERLKQALLKPTKRGPWSFGSA